VKRSLDVALATVLLVLLLPLFSAIGVAIKLAGGPGPILCQHKRERMSGGTLLTWRFRCLAGDLTEQAHPSPVGAWLRRSNLDLLPILLNVIRGDVSLDELGHPGAIDSRDDG